MASRAFDRRNSRLSNNAPNYHAGLNSTRQSYAFARMNSNN